MIRCAHCRGRHETVTDVRSCSGNPRGSVVTATKPPVVVIQNPSNGRQNGLITNLIAERDVTGSETRGGRIRFTQPVLDDFRAGRKISGYDASRLIDELLECPRLPDVQTPVSWKTAVPDGRYAVEIDDKVRFFRLYRTKQGFLKITERAGPAWHPRQFVEYHAIVDAILCDGPEVAGPRYGRLLGRCYVCGLELTDETSRALGIGPVCRSK